jgi:hypothetical protein
MLMRSKSIDFFSRYLLFPILLRNQQIVKKTRSPTSIDRAPQTIKYSMFPATRGTIDIGLL